MLIFFIKRILLFIPTLFIISLFAFLINKMAPGDPVERNVQNISGAGNKSLDQQRTIQKKFWRSKLGLDLPVFYISLRPFSEPDTLFRIYPEQERVLLARLINLYGNWPEINQYYNELKNLENNLLLIEGEQKRQAVFNVMESEKINRAKFECRAVFQTFQWTKIEEKLSMIIHLLPDTLPLSTLKNQAISVRNKHHEMRTKTTVWKNYIPAFSFYPMNQYHRWIFGDGDWITGNHSVFSKGIIRGDFGTSYTTGLPVMQELNPKIKLSLSFALLSILISYIISVPLGIFAASKENSRFDKMSGHVLFLLYSLPLFWFATMLLLLFANPDVLQWFPVSGIKPVTGYPEGASVVKKLWISLPHMILPVICYSYNAISFIARSLRAGMLGELKEQYIKTARAKGVEEKRILFHHAFRNSLLPMITLFANVLPASLAGSLIIETIFSIPGMGLESIYAIHNQNYPVIVAIFTLTGLLTLTAYLIADLLYAWADPRISFRKNMT